MKFQRHTLHLAAISQRGDRMVQRNNLRLIHGTATYMYSEVLQAQGSQIRQQNSVLQTLVYHNLL